jgi:hypothetical protein
VAWLDAHPDFELSSTIKIASTDIQICTHLKASTAMRAAIKSKADHLAA